MEENRARRVADALRDRGIDAHLAKADVYRFGVRVSLPDGREAVWDTDGTATLEALVMRDGELVGFVPVIEGSEDFERPTLSTLSRELTTTSRLRTNAGSHPRPRRPCRTRAACSAASSTASDTG